MKAVIVLPTYNEKENIGKLIPRIETAFKKIKHDMHILVVDDNSPDGTAKEVKKFQKKHKNIHILLGEKKGLGVAYLRGFNYAIKDLKADVVFMHDADLSHPPEMIPQFMKEIDNGYDLVIGSRYIKGGATPDWGIKRKLISSGGNFFARVVAGLYKVHDCTSGFRAFRASVFKKINRKNLHTRGYAFMTTTLYEMVAQGAKIKEIPLVFYDRRFGKTKLNKSDIIEFFFNASRLRLRSSKRMIKFGIVGGSGILVNLGLFVIAKTILYSIYGFNNVTLLVSSLTGDEISIIYNFFLNNFWTFRKTGNRDHIFIKMLKFHLIALTSVAINNIVMFTLVKGFGSWDVFSKFVGIVIAFIWNYLMNVRWTWREKL